MNNFYSFYLYVLYCESKITQYMVLRPHHYSGISACRYDFKIIYAVKLFFASPVQFFGRFISNTANGWLKSLHRAIAWIIYVLFNCI